MSKNRRSKNQGASVSFSDLARGDPNQALRSALVQYVEYVPKGAVLRGTRERWWTDREALNTLSQQYGEAYYPDTVSWDTLYSWMAGRRKNASLQKGIRVLALLTGWGFIPEDNLMRTPTSTSKPETKSKPARPQGLFESRQITDAQE